MMVVIPGACRESTVTAGEGGGVYPRDKPEDDDFKGKGDKKGA